MALTSIPAPTPKSVLFTTLKWLKRILTGTLILILLLVLVVLTGGYLYSGPQYQGPVTDHFDGERFYNPGGALTDKSFKDFIRWRFNRKVGPWRDWVPASPGKPPPISVTGDKLRVTYVNHATVLLQMSGGNILTDPIWSERASPISWIGPRRVRPPGIRFEDLPPIDAVVISHNHYDHLDLPTLVRLRNKHNPVFVVQLGNKLLLQKYGFKKIVELDWWEKTNIVPGISIYSTPSQHFSSRGFFDRNATLWGGYVIDGPGGRVFFGGDTGMGPHFDSIRKRFSPLRLALLPIGAFRPEWFMKESHMSPLQAIDAHLKLQAQTSMAMHYGTFHLGDDGETEPVERWRDIIRENGLKESRLWVLNFGEGRDVPAVISTRN
ncbi:MAG: MBL fold metallo-hydrolase [Acidiferrobacterales bacterium]